jgi:hypothetical protein
MSSLQGVAVCKIFILRGLWLKYSNQRTYVLFLFYCCGENLGFDRGFFDPYIQYIGWGGTSTPRECAELGRVLAIWGLDRFLRRSEAGPGMQLQEQRGKTGNCKGRSRSFASLQDDNVCGNVKDDGVCGDVWSGWEGRQPERQKQIPAG